MADKLVTYLDIPTTSIVPDSRTGFVRIYSRNNLVYAKDENGIETQLTNSNVPPPSSDVVDKERLVYDRPEVVPVPVLRDSLIPTVSESVPVITEDVVAALLAKAEEIVPIPVETIQTTVRPMISEVVPQTSLSESLATVSNEPVPVLSDTYRLDLQVMGESVPFPVEDVRIIPTVMAFEAVPLIRDDNAASIIEQDNFLPLILDLEPITANYTGYANANVTTTGWTSPANALGNNTNTAAELRATSSGLAGTTSNTVTGTLLLGFANPQTRDLPIGAGVTINIERDVVSGGTLPLGQSHTVVYQYSLDGTNFTTVSAPGTTIAKSVVTVDITSLVGGDYNKLDALQVRATGSVTSGTGLGATLAARLMRAWVSFTAEKTY